MFVMLRFGQQRVKEKPEVFAFLNDLCARRKLYVTLLTVRNPRPTAVGAYLGSACTQLNPSGRDARLEEGRSAEEVILSPTD
jgi:hypothetical protein